MANILKYGCCRIIILFLFTAFIPRLAFNQNYNFKHFNSEDGLPQPFIYSISQDSKGYLWIGTGGGLARFNGFEFVNFSTNDSLAEDFITCAIRAGDNMWFGHMNGKLTYYNGKKFKPVTLPKTSQSAITGMAKSPDGIVWVSTYSDGLFKVDKNNKIKHYAGSEPVIIKCLGIVSSNELLIGTNTGLIFCQIKNNSVEMVPVRGIPETKISSIKNVKGSFLVATEEEGVFLVNPSKKISVTKIVTVPSDITGIQDVQLDHLNNLWISTFGNGVVKFSPSSGSYVNPVYFNKSNGFVTDNSKLLFEDREGSLWSGHFGEGLTQITHKKFFVSNSEETITSLYLSKQYNWLGTDSGLVKTDIETSEILLHYKNRGLPVDKINTLYSPDGSELWIGTENNGIFRLTMHTDKLQKLGLGEDGLSNSINIITGKGNEVWIGTKKGLCHINVKSNLTKWYSLSKGGLPHNYINTVFIDSKNKVWVATRSSILSYIENSKVKKINLNTGNGNFELNAVTEDANSRIWAGSLGKGVFIIDKTDSIANLTSREGLLSDYCYSLMPGKTNVWIGHKGGLSRVTHEFVITPLVNIDNTSASYDFNSNAVVKDGDQKIYFGTNKGLVVYNPANENPNLAAPILVITSLKINDEQKSVREKIFLKPGNYKIRIDYLGLSLKHPELVTYQYKLEGFEQFEEITKNTSVTYNHLQEGTYTFTLKASDGEGGVTQTPLTFTIQINKPVWKQWWFFPISILLIFLIVFVYIKRREFMFLEEKKVLEEKVQERTAEIQTQKAEIEVQKDFIEEKNYQITSSIKYARHIQNAILPSADLIKKLLPNHFILSRPKDIVSGDFFWLAEKDSKIIFTVADCTGHGVPGAFMSLLGVTLLNEIVNIHGITNPAAIVTRLRERIIESLQQNKSGIILPDGMDMTLCVFDPQNQKLHYTGAKQDLVIIRGGNTEIIKADRFSVNAEYGIYKEFSCQTLEIKPGDQIYLFTDGYKDQFGGELDKKFMVQRFYQTLLKSHHLTMEQQKDELEKSLVEWMGANEQTDDILVLGVKF